jgi:hypothetical protein
MQQLKRHAAAPNSGALSVDSASASSGGELSLQNQSTSGGASGGNSGGASGGTVLAATSMDPPASIQRRRPRRVRRGDANTKSTKSTSTSTSATAAVESSTSSFNWVFTFLVLGLIFCLIDAVYIMNFIMLRHHSGMSDLETMRMDIGMDTTTTTMTNSKESSSSDQQPNKNHILNLLTEAGITDLDASVLAKLPAWSDVTALYGPEPVITGLESCQVFQQSGDAGDHFVATAGTFNTGTNLMAELLIANCHMPARMAKYGKKNRGVRWQVLWGKHTPVGDESFRQGHRTYNDSSLTADNIFSAVTVRDPFKWMQSMCRHEYGAKWHHDKNHCPNLVPNQVDRDKGWVNNNSTNTVPVTVAYLEFTRHHQSLVDFWNSWYQEYKDATFPRLLVRFEDLVFHPKEVTKTVCECAGGEMNKQQPFKYIVDSAKRGDSHGKATERTSYVDALVKYGTEKGRYQGMTDEDLRFAQENLDPALMKMFGYPYPSASAQAERA